MPGPPRRDRPTLEQRSAASGLGRAGLERAGRADTAAARTGTSSPGTPGDARGGPPMHCWVLLDGRRPRTGLLLEWRRTPTGWQGRVACTLGHAERPEDETVVVMWMPAEQLRPA